MCQSICTRHNICSYIVFRGPLPMLIKNYVWVGLIIQHTWVRADLDGYEHFVHLELTSLIFSKIKRNKKFKRMYDTQYKMKALQYFEYTEIKPAQGNSINISPSHSSKIIRHVVGNYELCKKSHWCGFWSLKPKYRNRFLLVSPYQLSLSQICLAKVKPPSPLNQLRFL